MNVIQFILNEKTTTWINLKFMMLSDRQQTEKTIRYECGIRFNYMTFWIKKNYRNWKQTSG